MRILILTLMTLLLFNCSHYHKKTPIEKYFGKNYIIWKIQPSKQDKDITILKLRNSENIKTIFVLNFDIELYKLKVGDTLK